MDETSNRLAALSIAAGSASVPAASSSAASSSASAAPSSVSAQTIAVYKSHTSLAYGADWIAAPQSALTAVSEPSAASSSAAARSQPAGLDCDVIATCSFYDKQLDVWRVLAEKELRRQWLQRQHLAIECNPQGCSFLVAFVISAEVSVPLVMAAVSKLEALKRMFISRSSFWHSDYCCEYNHPLKRKEIKREIKRWVGLLELLQTATELLGAERETVLPHGHYDPRWVHLAFQFDFTVQCWICDSESDVRVACELVVGLDEDGRMQLKDPDSSMARCRLLYADAERQEHITVTLSAPLPSQHAEELWAELQYSRGLLASAEDRQLLVESAAVKDQLLAAFAHCTLDRLPSGCWQDTVKSDYVFVMQQRERWFREMYLPKQADRRVYAHPGLPQFDHIPRKQPSAMVRAVRELMYHPHRGMVRHHPHRCELYHYKNKHNRCCRPSHLAIGSQGANGADVQERNRLRKQPYFVHLQEHQQMERNARAASSTSATSSIIH